MVVKLDGVSWSAYPYFGQVVIGFTIQSEQKINRPLLYSGRSMKNLYLTFVTNFIFSVLFLLSAQLLLPLFLRLL